MINSIQASVFPLDASAHPSWTSDIYIVMELLAILVQITLLRASLQLLDSFGEQVREDGRRATEDHRRQERVKVRFKGEQKVAVQRFSEKHFRLEEIPPQSPTEIALYQCV